MHEKIVQCLHFGNHFRFFSNYFATGLGFQLAYELTDVSHWSYNYGVCAGSFTTPNGIVTSPSHPGNYPDNVDCIYTISQPTGTVILLKFLSMHIDSHSSCIWDYLEIRDGPLASSPLLDKLCGSEIPASIQSRQNQLWIR